MPCWRPIPAYRTPGGGVAFKSAGTGSGYADRHLELSCGQCIGCRLERSRQWALRCVHEATLHEDSAFVTLTYDDAHLPKDLSVDVRHWQLFAKKLRKRFGPFRFFHCGEYGDENLRPHYHALIFGLKFPDLEVYKRTSNAVVCVSPELDSIWNQGFVTVGKVTHQSAAYCARYSLKKVNGPAAEEHYTRVDHSTGVCWSVKPEYVTMSRNKGIGYEWYQRWKQDLYPSDYAVHDGRKLRVPKYYDKLLEKENPDLLAKLKRARQAKALERNAELTHERLATRERVMERQMSVFHRSV